MTFLPVIARASAAYGGGGYGAGFYGGELETPLICVELDLDNDPTSNITTWTDVTADVVSYSRQPVRTDEFNQPSPATATIKLRNDQAQYTPDNPNGPHFGKLKKMRRCRVRAQKNGVIVKRFFGYVQDWPQSWDQYGRDQTVTLTLNDGLVPLQTYDLVGQVFPSASSGSAISAVLAAAGITSASLDSGVSTIAASGTLSSTFALSRVQDIAASENGVCFADGAGTIRFHDRHHRLFNSTAPMGTIGDVSGEIPYVNPQPMYGNAWPIVKVTPSGGSLVTSTDAAGTAAFFQQTMTFPPSGEYLVTDPAEAQSAADYLRNRYGQPQTRIQSVELIGGRDPTQWATILGLDTSTKVVFRRRVLSNGIVSGTVETTQFVEGYGDTVEVGKDWRVTVPLSPADIQSYWLLGDPVYGLLGQTTSLAF